MPIEIPRTLLQRAGVHGSVIDSNARRRIMCQAIEDLAHRDAGSVPIAQLVGQVRDDSDPDLKYRMSMDRIVELWLSYQCAKLDRGSEDDTQHPTTSVRGAAGDGP